MFSGAFEFPYLLELLSSCIRAKAVDHDINDMFKRLLYSIGKGLNVADYVFLD